MSFRIAGAVLIFSGCGWFGFSMANDYRHQERAVRQLIRASEYMECELQFRQTALPQLCHNTAQAVPGEIGQVFLLLEEQLERRTHADVPACMDAALKQLHDCSPTVSTAMEALGKSLGQFDLTGQISSLRSFRAECEVTLKELLKNRENRLRSYQTLGLCTGAALAVLLL